MAILVLSSSKRRIATPKHARRCVVAAISRILANEKGGLRWVLMYVPLFFLSFLVADILSQDGLPLKQKRGTVPLHRIRIQPRWIRVQDHPHIFEEA